MSVKTLKRVLLIVAAGLLTTLATTTLMAQDGKRAGGCGGCGGRPKATPELTLAATGEATACTDEATKGKARAGECEGRRDGLKRIQVVNAALDAAVQAVEAGDKEVALAELTKARTLLAALCKGPGAGCGQCSDKAAAKQCGKCPAGKPCASPEETAKFLNTKCPIMGSPIDEAKVPARLTREHNGGKVAFCCGACPGAWDKLSDDQKAAKLLQVAAK